MNYAETQVRPAILPVWDPPTLRDDRATLAFSKLLDRYLQQAVPSLIADDFKQLATRAYALADAMEDASNG